MYKIHFAGDAIKQLIDAIDYVYFVYCDANVAHRIERDFYQTIEGLRMFPRYVAIKINGKTYHKVALKHYSYIIIYEIVGDNVYIEYFFHMSQNYHGLIG